MNLVKFMCDFYNGNNIELNLHLMFIIFIKHSSFGDIFASKLPNGIMSEANCAIFLVQTWKMSRS